MKKAKYLLVMLFIIVAIDFSVYAQDYEVLREVVIDLEDYSEVANYGGVVSELIYHEQDSSLEFAYATPDFSHFFHSFSQQHYFHISYDI